MNRILLLLSLVLFLPLFGQPTVVDDREGVQILREPRFNTERRHYGFDYYAYNRNDYPVLVSIRLVSHENVYDRLVPGAVIVEAGEEISLGGVEQESGSEEAQWNFEWTVQPAEHSAAAAFPFLFGDSLALMEERYGLE